MPKLIKRKGLVCPLSVLGGTTIGRCHLQRGSLVAEQAGSPVAGFPGYLLPVGRAKKGADEEVAEMESRRNRNEAMIPIETSLSPMVNQV